MNEASFTCPVPFSDYERVVLAHLRELDGGGVVALSGGADSAVLLSLAAEAWGAAFPTLQARPRRGDGPRFQRDAAY